MSNYTETELQLIINKITSAQASTITMNNGELYLAPDSAVYSVNNTTPDNNGNVSLTIPAEGANKDLSNLSSTGNAKFQSPITGGASSITSSNLTKNRALVSDSSGKVAASSITSTKLGYLTDVTSNIQAQLNAKGTVKKVNNTSPDSNGNVSLTIPTVNNPTITITQGGVTKGSFNLNQSSGDTIALDAGGGDSLPSQTGHSGNLLTTDGTDASWVATAQIYPVIECNVSGSSWSVVYSNKFCIQGSTYYKGSTCAGDNTITFAKEFANTNYTFIPTPIHSNTNLSCYSIIEKYISRTTQQVTIYTASACFGYSWIAFGYIN